MLAEVGGTCNFDNMIRMFQSKMAGGEVSYINILIIIIECSYLSL
jgi:hypothetical protein